MTAQPSQRADLAIIEALDFEPEYACEWLCLGGFFAVAAFLASLAMLTGVVR